MLDIIWTKNKLHHHIILQLIVLSLLSTTIGPEHEPLLLRGVVSQWQTKSGAQCRAYGWWTGPLGYRWDAELLHDITSHPAAEQHHQLAYVGQQVADTKGCIEINFFWQKNSSKHMTFSKQPTGQHQAVHNAITLFTSANFHMLEEDSAQIPPWDTAMICDTADPYHSQGECWIQENFHRVEGEGPNPSWEGLAT